MKHKRILIFCAALLLLLMAWLLWGNNSLQTTTYTLDCSRTDPNLDGFVIVQISDLHNTAFGKDHQRLLKKIARSDPDMIAITGDLIDSRRTHVDIALHFIEQAVEIAPVYYVPGNHESRIPDAYTELRQSMEELGVHLMDGHSETVPYQGTSILCLGIADPDFLGSIDPWEAGGHVDAALCELNIPDDAMTVLLSHRPELFHIYTQHPIDLVLCGHAHGGQVRIPFIGGLIAPNQGFFPKYSEGMFTENDTAMVVSRGIGNSVIPLRINNPPEIVVVEFVAGE